MEKLKVEIKGKDYEIEKEVFDLIHSISLERDKLKNTPTLFKLQREASLNFTDWLMENCELSEDGTIWSYDSEDYTNERLYEIFESE